MRIPDEVRQWWATKAESLPDVALPYPSSTSLAIAGPNPDRFMAAALKRLISSFPGEVPLDGGPARCKPWDRALLDKYVSHAARAPRGLTAMEAVWLATDEAFYYITPEVGFYRLEWKDVAITTRKQGRKFSRVLVTVGDETHELRLGTAAMANLLAIRSWAAARK